MKQSRTPMPIENRAKQFMPFAALKGLPEALAAKEKIVVPKILRTEEMAQELDRQTAEIKKGIILSVIYYHNDEYIKLTGMVAQFDKAARILQVVDTKIPFDDILKIEF